jgi:hypothetical protein
MLAVLSCARGPAAGVERGPCRADRSCEQGLQCLSQLCVEIDGDPELPPEILERAAVEACACESEACVQTVGGKFREAEAKAKKRPLTAAEKKRVQAASDRIGVCVAKAAPPVKAREVPVVGIETCDRFIRFYAACVEKMPAAAREPAMDGLEKMVDKWRQAAGTSQSARDALRTGCESAYQNSLAAMRAACPDIPVEPDAP